MNARTPDAGPTARPADDYRELYTQVCESYRAIDDFRMKLLGLLPLATGAGVLVVLNSGKVKLGATGPALERIQQVLAGVAIFGVAITLGLFAYELHGIKKCGRLIKIGARIESDMGSSGRFFGQFATRPHRVAGFIDVPFASSVVYPAAVAVWVFVGLVSLSDWAAVAASGGTLVVLFAASVYACRRLDVRLGTWDHAQELLHVLAAEGAACSAASPEQRNGSSFDEHALERPNQTPGRFLAAMQAAQNPGMVRFGPPLRKRRGWAVALPFSTEDDAATPEQPSLYLSSDGDWWCRANGQFENLGGAPTNLAPKRIGRLLEDVLGTHDLDCPRQEARPRPPA